MSPLCRDQIFTFIGILESFSYEKCFYGDYGDGNLGFDPLQMGKNPASLKYYKVRAWMCVCVCVWCACLVRVVFFLLVLTSEAALDPISSGRCDL